MSARPGTHSTGYVARLEALRGFGTLIVAAAHCLQITWAAGRPLSSTLDEGDPVSHWLAPVYIALCNGQGALIVFFVISGFVLTRSLERGPDKFAPAARRYFIGRIFRLYPVIISTMLLFAGLWWSFGLAIPGVAAAAYSPMSLIRNMLLLESSIDGVTWSLQLELIAVGFIFIVVRWQRHWPILPSLILTIVLTLLSFSGSWSRFLGPGKSAGYLFAFAFGILLQSIDPAPFRRLQARTATAIFLASVALFFAVRSITGHWAPLLETCAATAMVGLLAHQKLNVAKMLDWRFARFYGKISYSFYLLHPLTLIVLWRIPEQVNALRHMGIPNLAIALGATIVSSAAITPLAWLSWRLVEWPAIGLGRRFVSGPKTFKAKPVPT